MRPAFALALVAALVLAGCADLTVAKVPDRLLEGSGGNGWTRNATASQKEPSSSQLGLTQSQTLVYDDRRSDQGYPGTLSVSTLRTLVRPSEEKLRDEIAARIKAEAEARGIEIAGEAKEGTRGLANEAESFWFVHEGTAGKAGFFSQSAQMKVFGEVWPCTGARESVVVVGLAQVTDVRTIGSILTQTNPDDTTWREIVADPRGRIDGYRGSNGLAYNVEC